MHRALPCGPAEYRRRSSQSFGGLGETFPVLGVDDRQNDVHTRMACEYPKAFPDHRGATHHFVLLGIIEPTARSASGCDHHGGDADCHALLVISFRLDALALVLSGANAFRHDGELCGICCTAALAAAAEMAKLWADERAPISCALT